MVPPKSLALMVTTAEPSHILQNTAAKTEDACFDGARMERRIDSDRQTISGPLFQRCYEVEIQSIKASL